MAAEPRAVAARLLSWLGPTKTPEQLAVVGSTPEQDWTEAGFAELGGQIGADRLGQDVVGFARGAGLALTAVTGIRIDGPALLAERAHSLGLRSQGRISAGGGARLLRADNGWWALNLARDLDLVPALTERSVAPADPEAAWATVAAWASKRPADVIIERTRLLGLAAARLGETAPPRRPWRAASAAAASAGGEDRLVVNMGALWAGPLAARLLGLTGARVVHVESRTRPDPSRTYSPAFYAQLRAGHEIRTLDFNRPTELTTLLAEADIVIEASRPRALRRLRADAGAVMSDGRARTWVRITGYPDPERTGFGDDAAVAAGLVGHDDAGPTFLGDAIADPLAGLIAALAAAGHHDRRRQHLIDLNLAEVAASARGFAAMATSA